METDVEGGERITTSKVGVEMYFENFWHFSLASLLNFHQHAWSRLAPAAQWGKFA
jgi:hypothetical protein